MSDKAQEEIHRLYKKYYTKKEDKKNANKK